MRAAIIAVMTLPLMFAGCSAPVTAVATAPPTATPNAAIAAEPELDPVIASITQQRRDQIKRVVSLRLVFGDSAPVSVTDVRLEAAGFARQLDAAWNHRPVLIQPHVAVALPITLTSADCNATELPRPASARITITDEQGESSTIELTDLPDAQLLERIRTHDCAVASLQDRAAFTLGADWRPAQQEGRRVWLGFVDIARNPPFGAPIEVNGALGSVLVDFTPVAPLPWRVPDQRHSRLPIVASSSGRCDGHSMGESSKPFVFTLWVRADGADVPLVLAVPTADLPTWWSLLATACDGIRQGD